MTNPAPTTTVRLREPGRLSASWRGDLTLVGPYRAGDADEFIVRNSAGAEMAVRARNLQLLGWK